LGFAASRLRILYHKLLKDDLKRAWVYNQEETKSTEKEKRQAISTALKNAWNRMADNNNDIFWLKGGLEYPQVEVDLELTRRRDFMEEENNTQGTHNTEMLIEEGTISQQGSNTEI
jgi:hypothetical protein